MLTRRSLVTGGIVAGAVGGPNPAVQARVETRDDEKLTRVLEEIRDELRQQRGGCSPASCAEANAIRTQQRTYLRGRGKFPDFIDVGVDVWESLWDWHVRAGFKPDVSRSLDGRYQMAFMQSLLVLRHEMPGNHIGLGYDGKAE